MMLRADTLITVGRSWPVCGVSLSDHFAQILSMIPRKVTDVRATDVQDCTSIVHTSVTLETGV
jgi:hypothetical protein